MSRKWYAMLESDLDAHVSPVLLGRIAGVLMLDNAEREELFKLVVPELSTSSLRPTSCDVLEAIYSVRKITRRLWTATTEVEVLNVLVEDLAARFGDADFVGSFRRVQIGCWEYPVVLGDERLVGRLAQIDTLLRERLCDVERDEAMLAAVLTQPAGALNRPPRSLSRAKPQRRSRRGRS